MKRRGLFFGLSIILIFIPIVLYSYDEETTHPGLTSEMVDLYNLSFPKRPLSVEEKRWVIQGSIDEDTWPRWVNHFYDPVYNQGWTAEWFGAINSSTGRWLNAILLSDRPPLASKYWSQSPSTQSEYKNFGGNRTWQRALFEYSAGNRQEAFYTLGHILHLLEDATVPEHTRGDTHAHPLHLFTGDFGSPYEKFSERYHLVGEKTNLPVTALNLFTIGIRPAIRPTLTAYFNFLATYSNNYFFSKDTVLIPKYSLPIIFRSDNNFGYGKDIDGTFFPLARKVTQRKADFSWVTAFVLNDVVVDKTILEGYFSRLSRSAIQNGAGVIKLFFEQTSGLLPVVQPAETSGVHSVLAGLTEIKNGYTSMVNSVQKVIPKVAAVTEIVNTLPLTSTLPQVLGEKIFPEAPEQVESTPVVAPVVALPLFGGTGGGATQSVPSVVTSPVVDTLLPVVILLPTSTTESVVTTTIDSTTILEIGIVTTTPDVVSTTLEIVTTTPQIIVVTTTPSVVPTSTPSVVIASSTPAVPCVPTTLNGRQVAIERILVKVNCPYLLGYYEIPVGTTLKVESGVVVKAMYADAKIDIFGSLVVSGDINEAVVLTSGRDKQTFDGAVFGNLSGVNPQPKDWQGLWFHPRSTGVLNNLTMRYAGKSFRVNNFLYTGFVSQAIRIENAEVQFNGGSFDYNGDVVVRAENSSLAIANSAFNSGLRAVESLLSYTIMHNASFTHFTDPRGPLLFRDNWPSLQRLDLIENVADVVYIEAALVSSTAAVASDIAYYLNNIAVANNATLTIEPGSLIYMADNSSLQISGTIVAVGSNDRRIHFRSFKDKTFWGALQFNGGHGRISHVVFEDGNYNFPRPAERSGMFILLNGSDVVINDTVISERRSPGNSIYIESSILVMNNSSIAQDEKSSFSNNGITVDQGTINLTNVLFANLTTGIKVISLPIPVVAISNLTTENVDNLFDPPGVLSL